VTLVTHGISPVQSLLQLHFSKYFLLGSNILLPAQIHQRGVRFSVADSLGQRSSLAV
jgi:hypothetical protein